MSLKAENLKSNESQKKSLAKEVTGILGRIDDELKVGHEQGKHQIIAALPITFSIPYMSNADAQRIIYYRVLTSLLDREFHVKVSLKDTSTLFIITWLSNDELQDIEIQTALLAKHSNK